MFHFYFIFLCNWRNSYFVSIHRARSINVHILHIICSYPFSTHIFKKRCRIVFFLCLAGKCAGKFLYCSRMVKGLQEWIFRVQYWNGQNKKKKKIDPSIQHFFQEYTGKVFIKIYVFKDKSTRNTNVVFNSSVSLFNTFLFFLYYIKIDKVKEKKNDY